MVIDFHTHIFPDKIAKKAVASLEDNIYQISGTKEYAFLDGTLSDIKASMQKNDITYSVIMPIATKTTQAPSINAFAASINGKDNIISFGSVHPLQEDYEEELSKIKELGLKGIKLHPEYQGFFIDSPESLKILKKAEELGLLVMLHTGEDKGIAPPVHCPPERLRNALNHLSGNNIIAAHMGGYNRWEEVLEYLCDTPIYLDTSYSVGRMSDELALEIFSKHGTDKILFGSDSPWQDQGDTVKALKKLGLDKDTENNILYNNGAKLLQL
ncbi:MAG: amidohydrolase family protein [Clostridia bacterium]|nr:amidohydrolase family protein [Clostridia bacterium]